MSKAGLLKTLIATAGLLYAQACLAVGEAVSAGEAASAPALVFKREADPDLPGAPQWMLAALLCAAALWVAVELLRKRGKIPSMRRAAGSRLLTVEERTVIAPQVQLVVARYGSRRLLLAAGPQGVQCLRDEDVSNEERR